VAELKRRKWTGIEIEDIGPIVDRFARIEDDRSVIEDLERSKNRLFTDKALLLRARKGKPLGNFRILDSQRAMLAAHENGHGESERQRVPPDDTKHG
jgi:hypothetical protein